MPRIKTSQRSQKNYFYKEITYKNYVIDLKTAFQELEKSNVFKLHIV